MSLAVAGRKRQTGLHSTADCSRKWRLR